MPKRICQRFNFTKAALSNLPLPKNSGGTGFYDEQIKQLKLTIFPSGKKTFSLSKNIGGKARMFKLGNYPDISIENARNKAREYLAAIAKGSDPDEKKRRYRNEMTLEQFFKNYCEDARKKTIGDDKKYYRLYLEKDWAKKRLSEITQADVEAKHSKIGKTTPYAANHTHALLRRLYNLAKQKGAFTGENPTFGVKRFPEKSRDRFLDQDELSYFLEAVFHEPPPFRGLFLLLLLTGQRKANVLSMQWKDIKFERDEWYIEDTKNNTPHTVPLTAEAILVLKGIQREKSSPWVFPSTGKTKHIQEPRKAWLRILKYGTGLQLITLLAEHKKWSEKKVAAEKMALSANPNNAVTALEQVARDVDLDFTALGFKNLRIHDLRRTQGSWQAIQGTSLQVIGKSLGHKSQAATAIYSRLNLDPVRDAMSNANKAIMSSMNKNGKKS